MEKLLLTKASLKSISIKEFNSIMTKFKLFLLEWICKSIVIQGPNHRNNIITYYKVIRDAAIEEFTEENESSLDSFLKECHSEVSCNHA